MEKRSEGMKYDHLIQSMESGALEKINDIKERTAREQKEILDQARAEGEQLKKEILNDIRKKAAIELNKQLYRARESLAVTIAGDHETALNEIVSQTLEKVGTMRGSPDYTTCFKAMLEEVLTGLGDNDIVLHVDPLDLELCKTLVRDRNPEIHVVADISTPGGLNGSSSGGKVVVLNTVRDRLERAKENLKPEIFRELYGD